MTVIARENRAAHAAHDLATNLPGDALRCDCGTECADLAAFHHHTVRTYNRPSPEAVEARGRAVLSLVRVDAEPDAEIVECTKVACYAQGNGRECFRLVRAPRDFAGTIYELTRADAERLRDHGGVVNQTRCYSFC